MSLDEGFREPPWLAPLDAAAVIARVPASGTMKGMFIQAMVAHAKESGVTLPSARPAYVGFKPYPLREHCSVMVEYARAIWPQESLRQGLRLIGRAAAKVMLSSTYGRVTVGSVDEPVEMLRQMAKTFATMCEPGHIDVLEASPGRVVLGLREFGFFLDCHHVGVYEGALRQAKVKEGRVLVRPHGASGLDLLCSWQTS